MNKLALIILDGWGINPNPAISAIEAATTPVVDHLLQTQPNATLTTFGEEAFRENELLSNKVFCDAIEFAKSNTKKIHLLGLVSDGGVHSHIEHLKGLCEILKHHQGEVEVYIHAFMDGRDTDPKAGKHYLEDVQQIIYQSNVHLATVIGRYYAMDRDKRWERVKLA